ncbi:MAG: hypothetical protein IPG39_23055 [Bacteroidetes bacterium]|nr:hypothetical protein [Bacteroidota bacterium]
MYLALGNPNAKIITLEGCPETAACARSNFAKMNCSTVTCLTGDFDSTLPEVLILFLQILFLLMAIIPMKQQ